MISFKQFLAEARMAPLYHGTQFHKAEGIIDNGGLVPITAHYDWKILKSGTKRSIYPGVSTTRSFKFAQKWAERLSKHYVVFELDQQRISHNYKVVPINFFQDRERIRPARQPGAERNPSNEFEEFILTDKNLPLKYVKAIHYYIADFGGKELLWKQVEKWKSKIPNIPIKSIKGSL